MSFHNREQAGAVVTITIPISSPDPSADGEYLFTL